MMHKWRSSLFLCFMVCLLCGCNEKLVDQLSERQANEVITLLEANNIDARKSDSGKGKYAVEVAEDNITSAISLLTAYNLPSADEIEISQQFPADAMVSTPLGEKARLISAIEQRLGQTLQGLENITSARVHLSYPGISPGTSEDSSMVASVLITYRGTIDEEEYTDKIRRFVKNSLQDMRFEDISVVMFHQSIPYKATKPDAVYPKWSYPVFIGIAVLVLLLVCCALFWSSLSGLFSTRKNKPIHVTHE
ncbi:type III secretion system inner membrane ring lipoprotein SctJ [Escherichia albertii]